MAAVAVALVAGLAGCGDDGDDAAPPPTEAPTTPAGSADATTAEEGETATTDPGGTSSTTTRPEGTVEVPLDPGLVDALPRLPAGPRTISTDTGFDERLCTGEKAPAVPKSQARATYDVSPTERITVAAYRFSADGGPLYLADYAEAVRACADAVGQIEGLGLPDAIGQAFRLTTTRGDAFIAMALRSEVIWVLFQESTAGPVDIEPSTLDAYLEVLGA